MPHKEKFDDHILCTLRLTVTAEQTCRRGSFGDSLAVISEPCLFYSIQAIPLLPTNATNAAMPPKKKDFLPLPTVLPMNQINRLPASSELSTRPTWVSVHFVSMVAWG